MHKHVSDSSSSSAAMTNHGSGVAARGAYSTKITNLMRSIVADDEASVMAIIASDKRLATCTLDYRCTTNPTAPLLSDINVANTGSSNDDQHDGNGGWSTAKGKKYKTVHQAHRTQQRQQQQQQQQSNASYYHKPKQMYQMHLGQYRHQALVQMMLSIESNTSASSSIAAYQRWQQFTPLHVAAALGHTQLVRALISRKCNIDARDSLGWTALHWSCMCLNLETTVELMRSASAQPYAVANDRHTTPMSLLVDSALFLLVEQQKQQQQQQQQHHHHHHQQERRRGGDGSDDDDSGIDEETNQTALVYQSHVYSWGMQCIHIAQQRHDGSQHNNSLH
jgi:hypothetical protein